MSKNMNDSAFSCGVRPAVEHPLGYGVAGADVESAETCMSENTTLPQRWSAATVCGVVNWKFIALVKPGEVACARNTHCSPFVVSTLVAVVRAWVTGMKSRVVEPITFIIHVANDVPLGFETSSIVAVSVSGFG